MQCGVVAIVLVGLILFGGGFSIGKVTQPITVINQSESHSTSIANAISMAGNVTVVNGNRVDNIRINIKGITNVMITTISNGVTNISK